MAVPELVVAHATAQSESEQTSAEQIYAPDAPEQIYAPEQLYAPDGSFGQLADLISEGAQEFSAQEDSPQEDSLQEDLTYQKDFAIILGEANERFCQRSLQLSQQSTSESSSDFSGWFGDDIDPIYGDLGDLVERHSQSFAFASGCLPAALPPAEDNSPSFESEAGDQQDWSGSKTEQQWDKQLKFGRTRRNKNQAYRRVVLDAATVSVTTGGERIEKFFNGAQVRKDILGRVTNVRSPLGSAISVSYDKDGTPQSFLRTDRRGHAHSTAIVDERGVIVSDEHGRVKAAGEMMSIDPSGCLSIRRLDGQFWSIDLVRQLHMERRTIVGADGVWNLLTAVFCADGFRMVTRFQSLDADHLAAGRFSWLSSEPAGLFRFYGRDGSIVQFESEDDLIDLKPARVWAPGSKHVDSSWRMHHQAGTAWESVQEYIVSYLSH